MNLLLFLKIMVLKIKLFADDAKLYIQILNDVDVVQLQLQLTH